MTIWYTLYTRQEPPCSYCIEAKELLSVYGKDFYEVDISEPGVKEMFAERGFRTVPQVFKEDRHIGGCSALRQELEYEQQEEERKHRARTKE